MTQTPFYERDLESYADDIITRTRPSGDGRGWYARLDCGIREWVSDPDFVGYGKTRAAAITDSAQRIRNDARGIGKFAPRDVLKPGYDLHFRLMRHWVRKEWMKAHGVDPDAFRARAMEAANFRKHWSADADYHPNNNWISWWNQCCEIEFAFRFAFLVHPDDSDAIVKDTVDAGVWRERVEAHLAGLSPQERFELGRRDGYVIPAI